MAIEFRDDRQLIDVCNTLTRRAGVGEPWLANHTSGVKLPDHHPYSRRADVLIGISRDIWRLYNSAGDKYACGYVAVVDVFAECTPLDRLVIGELVKAVVHGPDAIDAWLRSDIHSIIDTDAAQTNGARNPLPHAVGGD